MNRTDCLSVLLHKVSHFSFLQNWLWPGSAAVGQGVGDTRTGV